MSTEMLEQAISLIKEGSIPQAQNLLETILSADPQNFSAWGWYVKTYPKGHKRVKALELCLKYNPGNETVKAALGKYKGDSAQPKNAKAIAIDRILAILYLIVAILFIAQVVFAISMFNAAISMYVQQGFDELPLLIGFWFSVLAPQWLLLFVALPGYVMRRERQTPGSAWILKTSIFISIIFVVGEFILMMIQSPLAYWEGTIITFLFAMQFWLGFDFIASLGIATFLFLAFNKGNGVRVKKRRQKPETTQMTDSDQTEISSSV